MPGVQAIVDFAATRGAKIVSGIPGVTKALWSNQIARSAVIGAGIGAGGQMIYNASTGRDLTQGALGAGFFGALGGAGYGVYAHGAALNAPRTAAANTWSGLGRIADAGMRRKIPAQYQTIGRAGSSAMKLGPNAVTNRAWGSFERQAARIKPVRAVGGFRGMGNGLSFSPADYAPHTGLSLISRPAPPLRPMGGPAGLKISESQRLRDALDLARHVPPPSPQQQFIDAARQALSGGWRGLR